MDTYKLVRNIKVEDEYDILVAGAGPAGCAAAIAAARLGAKVLLVEAMGCLGGLSTAAVQSMKTGQTARSIDTQLLVETLRENGAYLPQTELNKTLTLE